MSLQAEAIGHHSLICVQICSSPVYKIGTHTNLCTTANIVCIPHHMLSIILSHVLTICISLFKRRLGCSGESVEVVLKEKPEETETTVSKEEFREGKTLQRIFQHFGSTKTRKEKKTLLF